AAAAGDRTWRTMAIADGNEWFEPRYGRGTADREHRTDDVPAAETGGGAGDQRSGPDAEGAGRRTGAERSGRSLTERNPRPSPRRKQPVAIYSDSTPTATAAPRPPLPRSRPLWGNAGLQSAGPGPSNHPPPTTRLIPRFARAAGNPALRAPGHAALPAAGRAASAQPGHRPPPQPLHPPSRAAPG